MNIAIDGPAGAGKSTIAKRLAEKLGYLYLDTGAMYRAVALKTMRAGLAYNDENGIDRMLSQTAVEIRHDNGVQKIFLDGEDVSEKIRENEVSKAASAVAARKCVRLKMVELQREIARGNNVILDGRDIGTYVLPHAEAKFYLTASVAERARRRYAELQAKGADCALEQIEKDIAERDYNDMHRDFAPLRQADDATVVDSSDMTIDEVADFMLQTVREKRA
ncbi:MAG: (d)CMP kinase [Clostridiales bacterium]|nr:(d)CMP kinase [Clostridiales bacterium]